MSKFCLPLLSCPRGDMSSTLLHETHCSWSTIVLVTQPRGWDKNFPICERNNWSFLEFLECFGSYRSLAISSNDNVTVLFGTFAIPILLSASQVTLQICYAFPESLSVRKSAEVLNDVVVRRTQNSLWGLRTRFGHFAFNWEHVVVLLIRKGNSVLFLHSPAFVSYVVCSFLKNFSVYSPRNSSLVNCDIYSVVRRGGNSTSEYEMHVDWKFNPRERRTFDEKRKIVVLAFVLFQATPTTESLLFFIFVSIRILLISRYQQ